MVRPRPARMQHIAAIGVDRMGSIGDASGRDLLRLENLDTDIAPDPHAIARTREAAGEDPANSYLPLVGQEHLRRVAAAHVSSLSGVNYTAENCIIVAGGLSGLLNALLATTEVGDEVVVTDPTYAGLLNRVRLVGGVPRQVPFIFTPGAPVAAGPRRAPRRGRATHPVHAADVAVYAQRRRAGRRRLGLSGRTLHGERSPSHP